MALSVPSSTSVGPSQPWIPVGLPSGTLTGDLLVCYHWLDNDGSIFNMSAPSGWVQQASIGNNSHGYAKIWTKKINDILLEPSTYQFGGTTGADGLAAITRVTGITSLSTVTIWAALAMNGTASPHLTPAAPANDTDNVSIIFGAGVVFTANTWGLATGYTNRGLALAQSQYMQGVVQSKSGIAGGIVGAQSLTTTAWNGFSPQFGDITGHVIIGQSAGGTGQVITTATAGVIATATLSSSIFPTQKYKYFIDWNGSGVFTDTGDDVSQRVTTSTVTINYGRDQARALAPIKPGDMSFELTNESGDYYPDKAASPLFGNLNPARPNLVQVTWQGVTYTLWRGHLDDYSLDTTPGSKTLSLTAVDPLSDLDAAVYTPLYRGVRSGDVVEYILDAIGWPSDKRDIDPGASVFPLWWEEGTNAWDALQKVVQSEGPPSFVTIDANGNIVYRDRHHRILYSASKTSQSTWRNAGADPRYSNPLVYNSGWRDIINAVTFSTPDRAPIDTSVVWSTDNTFNFAANQAISIIAVGQEPFMNAVLPFPGIDYILNSGSVSISMNRDSGQSVQILMKETAGATAMITGMALRANSLPAPTSTQVSSTDSVSIGKFGVKTYPYEAPWASVYDAQALSDTVVTMRSQRLPNMQLRFTGGNTTILTNQFSRNLSDRVTVVDTETGFSGDVFIEQIKHTITGAGGRVHETVFGVEKVAPTVDDPSTVFIFGSSTNGKFGTNVFGH